MNDYNNELGESVERLGTQGYCDIAAEILLESYPDARIFRFTDGDSFGHVFLVIDCRALDISGFKSIEEMSATEACRGLRCEPVTLEAVQQSFRSHGRTVEERGIFRRRFVNHIAQNPDIFRRDA